MITSVNIKNYKIFTDNTFIFRPITVLTGINSAGKSSMIGAIRLNKKVEEQCLNKIEDSDPTSCVNYDSSCSSFEICVGRKDGSLSKYIYSLNDDINSKIVNIDCVNKSDSKEGITYLSQCRSNNLDFTKLKGFSREQYTMDAFGENAGEIMCLFDYSYDINEVIINRYKMKLLYKIVESVLNELGMNVGILAKIENDISRIIVKQNGNDNSLSNVGYGIAYVLPIIVSALVTKPGSVLIIDSPEAHLHPMAQSKLGQFLVQIASTGVQVIIETHSDHVINGIQYELLNTNSDSNLTTDDVIFHFLSAKEGFSHQEIIIDKEGKLAPITDGFFDQIQKDLMSIIKLRMKQ